MGAEELVIRFLGYDLVSQVMWRIGNSIEDLGKRAEGMSGIQKMAAQSVAPLGTIGIGLLGISAALAKVSYDAVKAAASFQQQMTRINTEAAQGKENIAAMTQKVLDLAPAVGIGPEELAKGLYHIESLGYRGNDAMAALKVSAQGAKIGFASLEETASALGGMMQIGIVKSGDWAGAMGQLNDIVGHGNMRMSEFMSTMSSGWLATGKTVGLTMKDLGAALDVFTDQGKSASVSANGLRTSMLMMAAPSGPATTALAGIGMKQLQMAEDLRKPNGLIVALEDLRSHLQATGKSSTEQTEIIATAFGRSKSAGTILSLMEGLDQLKLKQSQLGDGAKDFAQAWHDRSQDLGFQMDQLKSSTEALHITLGQALAPTFGKILSVVAPIVVSFTQWVGHNKALVGAVVPVVIVLTAVVGVIALLGAGIALIIAAGGPMILMFLSFASGFAVFGGIVAILIGIGVAIWGVKDKLAESLSEMRNLFMVTFGAIRGIVQAEIPVVVGILKQVEVVIQNNILGAMRALEGVFHAAAGIFNQFKNDMSGGLGPVMSFANLLYSLGFSWDSARGAANAIVGPISNFISSMKTFSSDIQSTLGPTMSLANLLYGLGFSWDSARASAKSIVAVLQSVQGTFVELWNNINSGLGPIMTLANLLYNLGVNWNQARGFANGLASVMSFLGGVFNAIAGVIGRVVGIIAQWVVQNWQAIATVLAIIGAVMGAIAVVSGIIATVSAVILAFSILGPIIAGFALLFAVFYVAVEIVHHWGGAIMSVLLVVISAIVNFVAAAIPIISSAFKTIGDVFSSVAGFVNKWILPAIGAIIGAFGEVFGSTAPALKDAFKELGPIFGQVGHMIGQVVTMIVGLVQVSVYLIQQLARTSEFRDFIGILGIIAAVVGMLLYGVFRALIEFLKVFLPGAIHVAIDIIKILVDIIGIIVTVITGVVKIVGDIIRGDWKALWADAQNLVIDLVKGVLKLLSDLERGIVDLFNTIVGSVGAVLKGFVSGVIDFFKMLYNKLVGHSIIPDMINDIVKWFEQLPGRAWDALMGLLVKLGDFELSIAKSALGIGKGMVDGIAKGIGQAKEALLDKIKELGKDLPQPIKDILGIKSPSTVMADEIGQPMMDGMAMGITAGTANASAVMTASASKVASASKIATIQHQIEENQRLHSLYEERFNDRLRHLQAEQALAAQHHDLALAQIEERRRAEEVSLSARTHTAAQWNAMENRFNQERQANMESWIITAQRAQESMRAFMDTHAAMEAKFDSREAVLKQQLANAQGGGGAITGGGGIGATKGGSSGGGAVVINEHETANENDNTQMGILLHQVHLLQDIRDAIIAQGTNSGVGGSSSGGTTAAGQGSSATGIEALAWQLIQAATSSRNRGVRGGA